MTPDEFAQKILVLEKQGVKVEVFDEKKLKEIGADVFLQSAKAVATRRASLSCSGKDLKTTPLF